MSGGSTSLNVGCFNVRSLCNKVFGVIELLNDNKIDLCCVTETWMKSKDSAIYKEIHEQGFEIFNAPRRGRGGGVAFLFNSKKVKPLRNNTAKYSSFEALECVVKSTQGLIRFCVVYRSTQIASKQTYDETKVSKFLEEFTDYLDTLHDKTGTPIICGDFNLHLENPDDIPSKKFIDIYTSKGFKQHVNVPTHSAGGTLDLILTLEGTSDCKSIRNLTVEPDTGTTTDHYLVHFELDYQPISSSHSEYVFKEYRQFDKIDVDEFRADIQESPLCSEDVLELDLNRSVQLYQEVLSLLIDLHAPLLLPFAPSSGAQIE